MDQNTFLSRVLEERQKWDDLAAQVPEDQTATPGATGDWSLKDTIAHISWYEREMVNMLRDRAFAGSELWENSTDQRNAALYELSKKRIFPEVQAESRHLFSQLVSELKKLTDEDLDDPSRFAGMPTDWKPWDVIASNTYVHYEEHRQNLERFLSKR